MILMLIKLSRALEKDLFNSFKEMNKVLLLNTDKECSPLAPPKEMLDQCQE